MNSSARTTRVRHAFYALSPTSLAEGASPESTRQIHLLVNPCLENPSDDEVRPALAALLAGHGVESCVAASGAGDERIPDEESPVPSGKGRVLLVEDDPAFNEVTRDYLAECGYSVVAVQSEAEGIREVLADDFAMVLCDMEMPKMRGDMFYHAVERIRPRLCERFIFMTGHRGDARTHEFIKNVNGFVLRKPFQLKALEDSIAFTEVRRTFRSVVEPVADDPVPPEVFRPADPESPGPRASAVPTAASKAVMW